MPMFFPRYSSSLLSSFGRSAPMWPAKRLHALAPGLGLVLCLTAASTASARAQDPAPQAPPTQPAQTQPGPAQPAPADAAQQAPAQQTPSPASTTPANTQAQPSATAEPQAPAGAPPITITTTTVAPAAKAAPAPPVSITTTTVPPPGPAPSSSDGILEAELIKLLVGKPLFLRGCYLFDDLRFNERGGLYAFSPRGSFTLSGVQIERLHLTKKELILEGDRYGYRFLGALPGNNPTDDMERIKITPKKKVLRIRIEREEVVSAKKEKEKDQGESQPDQPVAAQNAAATAPTSPAPFEPATPTPPAADAKAPGSAKLEPLKDEPTTTSPDHAVARLKEALARLFTPSLDDRFIGSMPPFWQLYYKSLADKTGYHPADPAVLHPSQVDKKPRLVSVVDPPSTTYAQDYGVAGLARYHVVVGPDGKPGEIAISQPIGFGLDENAVETLKKATFEPAIKDGKPVSVVLDLDVQFHIYSKLTSGTAKPDPNAKPILPGPYSLPTKP